MIETKLADDAPSKSLMKFQNVLNVPAVQLVNKEGVYKRMKNAGNRILIVTAYPWLAALP